MSNDDSIIIIDLKADHVFFHSIRNECRARGIPFQVFTSSAGNAGPAFNPLDAGSSGYPQNYWNTKREEHRR